MSIALVLFVSGCASPKAPVNVVSPVAETPPVPMLLASSGIGNNKATISTVWSAVVWGRPVMYTVGYGTSPGNYSIAGTTTGTSFQVTGLQWQTLYYLSVKTTDSIGLQSPWSPWYHYLTGKPNHPVPQPPSPSAQ